MPNLLKYTVFSMYLFRTPRLFACNFIVFRVRIIVIDVIMDLRSQFNMAGFLFQFYGNARCVSFLCEFFGRGNAGRKRPKKHRKR